MITNSIPVFFVDRNFRSREDGLNLLVNGGAESVTSAELERVKLEILAEMRMEVSKIKDDIIQGCTIVQNSLNLRPLSHTSQFLAVWDHNGLDNKEGRK